MIFLDASDAAGIEWDAVDLTLVDDETLFIIHARTLTAAEKSNVRKRLRM